jgi:hypothetical protein
MRSSNKKHVTLILVSSILWLRSLPPDSLSRLCGYYPNGFVGMGEEKGGKDACWDSAAAG